MTEVSTMTGLCAAGPLCLHKQGGRKTIRAYDTTNPRGQHVTGFAGPAWQER